MQGYKTVRAKVSIISFFIFVCYPFSFVFWFGYDSMDWQSGQYFSINIGIFNLFHNFKKLLRHIKNTLVFYLFYVTIEKMQLKKLTTETVKKGLEKQSVYF